MKSICTICQKNVTTEENSVFCSGLCGKQQHLHCLNFNTDGIIFSSDTNIFWNCNTCLEAEELPSQCGSIAEDLLNQEENFPGVDTLPEFTGFEKRVFPLASSPERLDSETVEAKFSPPKMSSQILLADKHAADENVNLLNISIDGELTEEEYEASPERTKFKASPEKTNHDSSTKNASFNTFPDTNHKASPKIANLETSHNEMKASSKSDNEMKTSLKSVKLSGNACEFSRKRKISEVTIESSVKKKINLADAGKNNEVRRSLSNTSMREKLKKVKNENLRKSKILKMCGEKKVSKDIKTKVSGIQNDYKISVENKKVSNSLSKAVRMSTSKIKYILLEEYTRKGNSKLFDSIGYSYSIVKRNNSSIFWRCSSYGTYHCKVIIRHITENNILVHSSREHNHRANVAKYIAARKEQHIVLRNKEGDFASSKPLISVTKHIEKNNSELTSFIKSKSLCKSSKNTVDNEQHPLKLASKLAQLKQNGNKSFTRRPRYVVTQDNNKDAAKLTDTTLGFSYQLDKITERTKLWICVNSDKEHKCEASVKQIGSYFIRSKFKHNHKSSERFCDTEEKGVCETVKSSKHMESNELYVSELQNLTEQNSGILGSNKNSNSPTTKLSLESANKPNNSRKNTPRNTFSIYKRSSSERESASPALTSFTESVVPGNSVSQNLSSTGIKTPRSSSPHGKSIVTTPSEDGILIKNTANSFAATTTIANGDIHSSRQRKRKSIHTSTPISAHTKTPLMPVEDTPRKNIPRSTFSIYRHFSLMERQSTTSPIRRTITPSVPLKSTTTPTTLSPNNSTTPSTNGNITSHSLQKNRSKVASIGGGNIGKNGSLSKHRKVNLSSTNLVPLTNSTPLTTILKKKKNSLPAEIEEELIHIFNSMDAIGVSLTNKVMIDIAQDYFESIDQNLLLSLKPTRKWVIHFVEKHKAELRDKYIYKSNYNSLLAISLSKVSIFLKDLELLLKSHKVDINKILTDQNAHRVFNCDTIELVVKPITTRNLITHIKKRGAKVQPQNRIVNILCCINAKGQSFNPLIINKGEKVLNYANPKVIEGTYKCACSSTGELTKTLFLSWMSDFIKFLDDANIMRPVVLFLNGTQHFVSWESLNFANSNGVILYHFPPYSARVCQPLSISILSTIRKRYRILEEKFNCNSNQLYRVFPSLFMKAYNKVDISSLASEGFRITGICPLNKITFVNSELRSFKRDKCEKARSAVATNKRKTRSNKFKMSPKNSITSIDKESTCGNIHMPTVKSFSPMKETTEPYNSTKKEISENAVNITGNFNSTSNNNELCTNTKNDTTLNFDNSDINSTSSEYEHIKLSPDKRHHPIDKTSLKIGYKLALNNVEKIFNAVLDPSSLDMFKEKLETMEEFPDATFIIWKGLQQLKEVPDLLGSP